MGYSRYAKLLESGFFAGLTPLTFWLVSTWPGQMNADSTIHWNEALSGRYSNWFPVLYSQLIHLSQRASALSPAPIVVIQSFAILYCATSLVCSLTKSPSTRNLVLGIYFTWPQTGGQAVLLNKEAIFLAAILGLTSSIIRAFRQELKVASLVELAIFAFLVTAIRWNGPIVVGGLICLCILHNPSIGRRVTTTLVFSLFAGLLVLFHPPHSSNDGGRSLRTAGQALDIAWSLRSNSTRFADNDLRIIAAIAPTERWIDSQSNCDDAAMPLLYDVFAETPGANERLFQARNEIRRIWIDDVLSNPMTALVGRICKVKGLLIPAFEWWPSYSSPAATAFDAHWNIDMPRPPSTRLATMAAQLLNTWGGSLIGIVLAMPFFWLLLAFASSYLQSSPMIATTVLKVVCSMIVLSVFVGGVGLEPRYVFPASSLLMLFVATRIVDWWSTHRTTIKRP